MRAACYLRVSTEEQARHGISLEAQKADLETFCKDNRYTVVDFYADEGISARKPAIKRPALQRLLADVEQGKIDLILFTKLDRWTRNVREYHKCQEVLERHNVPWKATQEDYETQTAAGRFKVNIMLAVAEDEADRTSERIKFVFEQKRQKKEPLTGNCPTGYKLLGKRIVKDDNSEAVQAFFDVYLDTLSITEARTAAAEKGLPIQYQLARKMLRSPCYYGEYYGVKDMAEPYITETQFEKIQAAFPRRIKANQKYFYVFSGLVFCGECGRRMGGKSSRHNSQYYNCVYAYVKDGCSNHANYSERTLENLLLKRIESVLSNAEPQVSNDTAKDINEQIDGLKLKIGKLTDLYINGIIDLDEAKLRKARYETEINDLRRKLPHERLNLDVGWREMYDTLTPKERRSFWRLAIDRVVIHADRSVDIKLR